MCELRMWIQSEQLMPLLKQSVAESDESESNRWTEKSQDADAWKRSSSGDKPQVTRRNSTAFPAFLNCFGCDDGGQGCARWIVVDTFANDLCSEVTQNVDATCYCECC